MAKDHERIWLQNEVDGEASGDGRMWCQDKIWPDDPEDGEPTEYVRADLLAVLEAQIADLKRALDTARHDAMEEAANVADRMLKQAGAAGLGSVPGWAVTAEHCISTIEASWAIPAAIRALSASPLSQGGQE